MAIHEELNTDDAALPFMAARANRLLGTDNAARTAGVIVVPNRDGTDTVLGVNGVAPWVGDTTPPGRPLDIEATSHLGTALIRWDGALEGGIPEDFRCVQVWARPADDVEAVKTLVGVLSSAGEVNTGVFDAGTVLDVWATALDDAHDRDGAPAYNESEESNHVQVEILPIVSQQEFDEAADNILAAADESVKAQIDKVNKDIADTSDKIDAKADEILQAAAQDATSKADAVDKKLAETNGKVQANADAIEAEAKKLTDYASANDTKMGEVDKDIANAKQGLTDLSEATSKAQLDADKANRAVELARRDAQELLVNGGFEDGPDGWKTNIAGAAFTHQSSWSRSGGYRAYLSGSLGTSELVSVKPIAVTTGHRYRFDAWYKLMIALSGAGDAGGLRLQYTGDVTVTEATVWRDFSTVANFAYTGDTWTQAAQTVLITNGVRWIRARVSFPQPVDAYVDDCSVIDYTHIWELEQAAKSAQDTADAAKEAAKDAGDAAALAKATADGKNAIYRATTDPAADADVAAKLTAGDLWWQTSLPNLETRWTGEPNNSPSVLVDHSNEIEHMWVWDGTKWNSHTMYAEDLLVNGSIVTELLAADCVEARNIKAGAVEADAIDATALYGKTIKGGVFLTSNERLVVNNEGILLKDAGGNATITMNAADGSATFRDVGIVDGALTTPTITTGDIDASTIHGSTVTGGTVQTVNDANRGIKLTGGNLDIYREDQQRFLRANEAGISVSDGTKNVLTFAPIDGVWTLSLDGAIQSGGEISGAAITGAVIRTNTQWDSTVDAEKYRGVVITDGGMYAYKNNGKNEYSLAFNAMSGELLLNGAISTNGELQSPTITAGQITGANIYTSDDEDNRVAIDSQGLTVTRGGETVISFRTDAPVDVGVSGLVVEETLDTALMDVNGRIEATNNELAAEVDARRQYMSFDSVNGLMIGDMSDDAAYRMQLTSNRLEFKAGDAIAAYVSNEQLYINNAQVLSTLRIGGFAWLPRENGHMSLQYVGSGESEG